MSYIQSGGVKLSVLSKTGKEAVVAMLGPGDFFGEGVPGGSAASHGKRHGDHAEHHPARPQATDGGAAAQAERDVRSIHLAHADAQHPNRRGPDRSALQLQRETAGAHTAPAGALREAGQPVRMVPKISQDTLAEMVGTTRSRVNFFLNKFKKLGFIE